MARCAESSCRHYHHDDSCAVMAMNGRGPRHRPKRVAPAGPWSIQAGNYY
jgi:hypothetical protein